MRFWYRFIIPVVFLFIAIIIWFTYTPAPLESSQEDSSFVFVKKDIHQLLAQSSKWKQNIKSEISLGEDAQARASYENKRLRDPKTGRIPKNIHVKELLFAKKMPKAAKRIRKNGQAQNWQFRGPDNVGGRTRALGMDIRNENIILAGGASGGMWRSVDGGNNWNKVTQINALQSVTSVVQDTRPGKEDTWYYGTGELRGNTPAGGGGALLRGDGVFKSTDNGQNWELLASTSGGVPEVFSDMFQYVWNIAIDPSNTEEDEVYAAVFGGINRSVDGGQTWTTVLGSIIDTAARFTDVTVTSQGVVYAALSNLFVVGSTITKRASGFYRSEDGVNWTEITPLGFRGRYNRTVMAVDPSNEDLVYFLTDSPASRNEVELWQYNASRDSWTVLSRNLPTNISAAGNFNSQQSYNMLIKVKPDDSNVIFIGGTNLYRSTDGFRSNFNTTWIGGYDAISNSFSITPGHHPDQHNLIFYPSDPNRVLSSNDGGVSLSNNIMSDLVVWEAKERGYVTTQFYTLGIDPNNDVFVGGTQDNGTLLTDGSDNASEIPWTRIVGGDGSFCEITDNSIYTSAQNGFMIRFAFNDSGNFLGSRRIDPVGGAGYRFINPFKVDPNNQFRLFLPTADCLWVNTNILDIPLNVPDEQTDERATENWEIIARLPEVNDNITSIEVSNNPEGIVYLGTEFGRLYKFDFLGDQLINNISSPIFPPGAFLSSIAVDPNDADHVVVAFSNYNIVSLFSSRDGGVSWTAVAGNLEENTDGTGSGPSVGWISILPLANNQQAYLAGTSIGLFSTFVLDGEATQWEQEGADVIGNVVIDMIRTRNRDGLVAVATHGNGTFSTNFEGSGGENLGEGLGQVFPNPFNTSTTIRYELAQEANVTLEVFDAIGRKMITLIRARQNPGKKQVSWSGNNDSGGFVAAGLYLCRLKIDDRVSVKKIVLER